LRIAAGVEIFLSREPESLVLEILRNSGADVARVDEKVDATKTELRSEIRSPRADVASDFVLVRKETSEQIAGLRKETSEQIAGLRRAVVEYHSVVLGHGILISELEARVRRLEQHVGLPAMDPG
jgi:hypothetical protein